MELDTLQIELTSEECIPPTLDDLLIAADGETVTYHGAFVVHMIERLRLLRNRGAMEITVRGKSIIAKTIPNERNVLDDTSEVELLTVPLIDLSDYEIDIMLENKQPLNEDDRRNANPRREILFGRLRKQF